MASVYLLCSESRRERKQTNPRIRFTQFQLHLSLKSFELVDAYFQAALDYCQYLLLHTYQFDDKYVVDRSGKMANRFNIHLDKH